MLKPNISMAIYGEEDRALVEVDGREFEVAVDRVLGNHVSSARRRAGRA